MAWKSRSRASIKPWPGARMHMLRMLCSPLGKGSAYSRPAKADHRVPSSYSPAGLRPLAHSASKLASITRSSASWAAHNDVTGESRGEACLGRRLPSGDRQHLLWRQPPEGAASHAGAKHRNGWSHYGTGYPGSLFHKEPYLSTNI